jgi:ABC-type nitrate/sulfonate/bicarbonate transport system substrate-binding protein
VNRLMKSRAMLSVRRFTALPLSLLLLGGSLLFIVTPGLRMFAARADADAGRYEVSELHYQGWTGQVLFPELAEDLGYLAPIHLKWVGNTISGPQDIQSVVTGDTDFGGAFNGSVVKAIAAHAPITAVIAYYGADKGTYTGLYVLNGSAIKGARDLIGKKVGMNTLGAYQEYLLTDYLLRSGLTAEDIKHITLVAAPPVSLAQTLRQGRIDATFLSDIIRDKAVAQGGIHPLVTDFDVYGPFSLGSYVLTDKFIADKPNAAGKFVEATARAIEWARTTPRPQVIARLEQITKRRQRAEDPTLVDYWQSPGVAGRGGLISDQEFASYIDWYVRIGQLKPGEVKASDVYTNRLNPFRDMAAK